jgi:hypothetical protein
MPVMAAFKRFVNLPLDLSVEMALFLAVGLRRVCKTMPPGAAVRQLKNLEF